MIFQLPSSLKDPRTHQQLLSPSNWTTSGPLAYVEWYTKLAGSADPTHMMYSVNKLPLRVNGKPFGEIVPISMVRQSCQLVPSFPDVVPNDWESHNVLDKAHHFLLNNSASKYAYQTLW